MLQQLLPEINKFYVIILKLESVADIKQISEGSPHQLSVLQTDVIGNSYNTGQKQFNPQQEHQEEAFLYGFHDPIADYLESLKSIEVKLFLSNECWFHCLSKMHFCMPWVVSFVRFGSRVSSVNQFFAWLHWKHDFT